MALPSDGAILGLEVESITNLGAYMTAYGAGIAAYLYTGALSGAYAIPAVHCRVRGAYSNTTPVDAYRGAGRPEAPYLTARLLENGERELDLEDRTRGVMGKRGAVGVDLGGRRNITTNNSLNTATKMLYLLTA